MQNSKSVILILVCSTSHSNCIRLDFDQTKTPTLKTGGSFAFLSDRGGIQTPNPQSRNLMRYSVAPRSHFFWFGEQLNPF